MLRVGMLILLVIAGSSSGIAQGRGGGGALGRGLPADQTNTIPPPPPAEDIPIFRAITRLVQVDLVVRGKDAPVDGLTQADFELKDNGKLQKVAVFAVHKAAANPTHMQVLPGGIASNRPLLSGSEPVSATILFLDRLLTEPPQQEIARLQAIKFLKQSKRHDLMAIYSLNSDIKVIQPFTDDHEKLLHALENSKSEIPYIAKDTPGAWDRIAEVTTASFQELTRQMKGLPGRKKLVWMSAGVPFRVRPDGSFGEPKNETVKILTISGAIHLLNEANAAFYPVSVLGVTRFLQSGGGPVGDIAVGSGGRAFYGDNGLDAGLQEALDDTDTIYTLGFYQPPDAKDGDYHSISVKVLKSRPATQGIKEVRYREGYGVQQERVNPLTDRQRIGTLSALVQETLDATGIGIQAAAVPSKGKPGYYDVELAVDVADLQLTQKDGRRVGSFDVSVVPDTAKPKGLHQVIAVKLKEANYAEALAKGITVVNQVKVVDDKGKLLSKTLRFVVMDAATGKAGSVRIPISPPALAAK